MRFVYVNGLRGISGEKWPDDMPVNNTRPQAIVGINLSEEDASLKIADLEKKYPYETLNRA